jgi:hypothetical protein
MPAQGEADVYLVLHAPLLTSRASRASQIYWPSTNVPTCLGPLQFGCDV